MAGDSSKDVGVALLAFSATMAALAASTKHVRDRYYKGQTVSLDGYTFTNCCFENCVLSTQTGAFLLSACRLINCTSHFAPNAVRIVRLFHTFAPYTPFPNFNPLVAADGSVTIN